MLKTGGEGGIRTHGTLPVQQFSRLSIKPLFHLSFINNPQKGVIYFGGGGEIRTLAGDCSPLTI